MVPVLMSAKMTTALVAVVGACVIGTGIVAGTVAENRAESATTVTVPVTVSVPIGIPPEPPPIPVTPPGPTSAPVGPGETTGATTIGTTTAATAAGATTVATVDTTTTGPPLCFPCITLPDITLPTLPITLPTVTVPDPPRVPTVHLGAAANYAVLAASTVTNTGLSVITGNLGLSPGTSVTGFLPGLVVAPGVIDTANAAAGQAQADLTGAYLDAAGRTATTIPAELAGLVLGAGVYAGPGRSPLHLTGTLTLDGGGDPGAVFIFQTDSTLVTASGSTVRLINGARACNVFWQVGSSATLGTGSTFAGTIMALASITVTTGVNIHGRALARNAAVTLDTNIVSAPTC